MKDVASVSLVSHMKIPDDPDTEYLQCCNSKCLRSVCESSYRETVSIMARTLSCPIKTDYIANIGFNGNSFRMTASEVLYKT